MPATPDDGLVARGIRVDAPPDLKRAANAILRRSADGPFAQLPYFCECDDPGCLLAVWLTAAEYDLLREEDPHRPLLAGHELYATSR
jgi:hypothetical protein